MKRSTQTAVAQAMRLVAKLGGFFARKSDGNSGFFTIWRGLKKLSEFMEILSSPRSLFST
ncbi:MAG: hypothetical protein IPJ71_01330 [Bdellovibrionales bacterium]|nr:hypothetical protein [Bdellovibrionales bacterium]